jgi:hypothetical protein
MGFGLPTKYGQRPVALVISAATEPVAGSGQLRCVGRSFADQPERGARGREIAGVGA